MLNIVLDCDPGIDDALALLMAAASPSLNLLAVTTVVGNRPLDITTANARRLLDLAGRTEVPVYAGCARPMASPTARCNLVHGEDGLGGVALPPARPVEALHAVDHLVYLLQREPAGSLTLIAIGPLTNLAMAEVKHPGLLRRARALLVMGGAAFRRGNITEAAEFNFFVDPSAASVVLNAGAATTLFGLDVTQQAAMGKDWIASFSELGTRTGTAVQAMLAAYAFRDPLLHDACPVAYALQPQLFRGRVLKVDVERAHGAEEGRLRVLPQADLPPTTVITDVDRDALLACVRAEIARLP